MTDPIYKRIIYIHKLRSAGGMFLLKILVVVGGRLSSCVVRQAKRYVERVEPEQAGS